MSRSWLTANQQDPHFIYFWARLLDLLKPTENAPFSFHEFCLPLKGVNNNVYYIEGSLKSIPGVEFIRHLDPSRNAQSRLLLSLSLWTRQTRNCDNSRSQDTPLWCLTRYCRHIVPELSISCLDTISVMLMDGGVVKPMEKISWRGACQSPQQTGTEPLRLLTHDRKAHQRRHGRILTDLHNVVLYHAAVNVNSVPPWSGVDANPEPNIFHRRFSGEPTQIMRNTNSTWTIFICDQYHWCRIPGLSLTTGKNGELWAIKTEEKMSSWWNDIQSLVKKCRLLAFHFFPKCRIGVECLNRGGGSRWPLHQFFLPYYVVVKHPGLFSSLIFVVD
jgi:hypothetical protein